MELNRLIDTYFNQDCYRFGEITIDEVITEYINSEPPMLMKELIKDIDYFIHNSEDVEREFEELHCHSFNSDLWEITALNFLNHVSERVQDYLEFNGEKMELNRLIGAYFNQDCEIISGPEIDDTINDYLETTTKGMKRELLEEIKSFIHNSKDLEKEFRELYRYDFNPDLWETTALDFLNHVSKRVRNHLDNDN
ncbi:contact-dependent growth inhibition system immunity protein [Photorhabdus viridis]|uniref:contact-dependent growth inhibition system immunity protein n=1 Tax=Photorhabdus viridis TaxID=3163327 RepID=UPI003307C2F0